MGGSTRRKKKKRKYEEWREGNEASGLGTDKTAVEK